MALYFCLALCVSLLVAVTSGNDQLSDSQGDGVIQLSAVREKRGTNMQIFHNDDDNGEVWGRQRRGQGHRRRQGHQGRVRGQGWRRRQGRLQRRRERINRRIAMGEVSLSDINERARRFITFLKRAEDSFTARLHQELRQEEDLVYSPYGIYKSLSMGYMGARSLTAFQMKRALHLQGLGRRVHKAHKKMEILLNSAENVTIHAPSGIFIRQGASLVADFSSQLTVFYQANVTQIAPEDTEAAVSGWVSARTNNLVEDFPTPGSITDDTSMVFVSTFYFKSKWKTAFPADRTREEMFSRTLDEQVPVSMMEVESLFRVGLIPGHAGRVLELPFQDNRFSMFVLLPDNIDGLSSIEQALTSELLNTELDTVIPSQVKVQLPRFNMETALLLKDQLQTTGIQNAFTSGAADFSGIVSGSNVHVSEVLHKAVVSIDEEGAMQVGSSTGSNPSVTEFRCDRPFLFIIRHTSTKINMLVGKFSGNS